MEIINAYFDLLWTCFKFDIGVYSNWLMWIFACIPIFFYTIFFVLKWTILTLPLTFPFTVISNAIRNAFSVVKPSDYDELKKKVAELETRTTLKQTIEIKTQ